MIRKATVFDAEEIMEMWVKCAEENPRPFNNPDEFKKETLFMQIIVGIKSENTNFLILDDGSGIEGFIHGNLFEGGYDYDGIKCQIDAAYINPEYRGKGLFKSLMAGITQWAIDACATRMIIETSCSEKLTAMWDAKQGYKPVAITYIKEI